MSVIGQSVYDLLDKIERLTDDNRALAANLARAENLIDTLSTALRQWTDEHKTTEGPKP